MNNPHEILWRNQNQILTPELIVGILHGLNPAPQDNALAAQFIGVTESYGGCSFQVERLSDLLPQIREMHVQQWNEVEQARDILNPDYDSILQSERDGRDLLFTARKDGELVGNVGCYLYRSLHTQNQCAREDAMYLIPAVRKGRLAIKFFEFCERNLVALKAQEITITTKTSNDVHKLWERKGYAWTDRVLTKTFPVGEDDV